MPFGTQQTDMLDHPCLATIAFMIRCHRRIEIEIRNLDDMRAAVGADICLPRPLDPISTLPQAHVFVIRAQSSFNINFRHRRQVTSSFLSVHAGSYTCRHMAPQPSF